MKRILLILSLLSIVFISCSRKITPSTIVIENNCDSLITETLKNIEKCPPLNKEDSFYNSLIKDLKQNNLDITRAFNDSKMEVLIKNKIIDSLKNTKASTYIDKSKNKTKIKNSYNDEEVIKLKNSMLIKDSKLDSVVFLNTSLNSKVKQLEKENTKLKAKGNIGDNSPNKSGNVTKNSNFWYGVLCGSLGLSLVIIIFKLLKTRFKLFPFI